MNPSNPFGSLQPGAFQAANSTMKPGGFPSFGQSNTQAGGLFSSSAFTQPTGLKPNTLGGNPNFGQGLSSSQTPAFGQPVGMSSSGFGASTPPFGQNSKPNNQSSLFGHNPSFGQTPGFGQQASALVKQPPQYGHFSSGTTSSVGFGASVFGKPATTSASTSVFGTTQDQNKSFGSEFSFKPANEAVFKPIFSANPSNPTSFASSTFGSVAHQTSTSTMMTGTNSFSQAQSAPAGFSFSTPEAAPSLSAASNQFTAGTTGGLTSTPQFTFSQPAAPSSTKISTMQPTSPSSFSFTAKPLFGGGNTGPSAFGEVKAETSVSNKGVDVEGKADTNIFGQFPKGTKRKEEPTSTSPARDPAKPNEMADTELPRQPPKRPLMRTRGPTAGLFGKALSGIKREMSGKGRQEPSRQPPPLFGETDKDHSKSEHLPSAPPAVTALTRDQLEKPTGSAQAPAKAPPVQVQTPEKLRQRRRSSETLGGLSPTDCTALHCRNIPTGLKRKDELRKHFSRFGKVDKIFYKAPKNMAIVHFADHASAAKAKKKGKMFHQHELLLLWQRKKLSPGNKTTDNKGAEVETHEDVELKSSSSPLRRPQLRPPALSSLVTGNQSSPVKKSTLAKCLQFDSEPQSAILSQATSSDHQVPTSLLPLIGQTAETSEDKYRLLEQRDKILRQGRPKRTDLESSKGFVGTCPDMCPEKERYMRETRNQLSMFEVIQDTELVDHAKAIKEYSRSSADQEEPLPFDLRPLPVLSRTMDYLITQIMDHGQDNPRDWYDFVWNRTRGIRKDITQQCLCCPLTVSLIEKCTRFHVHCAHHLCQESLSIFDAKINNENLTKCLQSLKEMYEDLNTRDIYCPQEAEFRQYSILIKLNDGDFLGDVQQYRAEVRNSPEVKFAVSAFAALNSNNYVLFFKLVKGASYLANCLLHRYFNQVRATALKIMAISYTVGPRSTLFPVEDIVRMLMFNNETEATDFIQQYGLVVQDGMVELNRVNYQEPDLPLCPKKSQVIIAKKQVLIGEVVNGSAIPNPPQHAPVCSFDSRDKYRGGSLSMAEVTTDLLKVTAPAETVEAEDPRSFDSTQQTLLVRPAVIPAFGIPAAVTHEAGQSKPSLESLPYKADAPQLFQPIAEPPPAKPPSPPPKPQPVYTNEDIASVLDNVIDELISAGVNEIATAAISYVNTALEQSCVQVETLVVEVTGQMLREVSTTEISLEQHRLAEEKRRQEEARRRQEHEAFLDQLSSSLCTEFVNQVVSETTKEIAVTEIQQALDEKERRLAESTREVCGTVIEESLKIEIKALVKEILEVELSRIHKYIKRWRDVVTVRRQLKRQMRSFPAASCSVHPHAKLKALTPSAPAQPDMADLARGLVNLGNAGTLALSSTRLLRIRQEVIHRMRVHNFYQQLLEEVVWAPLDLPALVAENLHNPPDRVFWKAVLLLPSDYETAASPADRILSNWLEVKLGDPKSSQELEEVDGKLQTLNVSITPRKKDQHIHHVHVSVKASRGPLTEDNLSKMESHCELQGSSAVMLLLPALPVVEQDIPLLSALLQLKQLQQANRWHCPLPLVILVPGHEGNTCRLEEDLMLQTLKEEGLISEFTFLFIPESTNDLQGSKQLNHAVRWLLTRAPPHVPLACQTLVQLVEGDLSRELNPRVYSHSQERASARLPPQHPAPIVRLYNAILTHIADGVSSPELCQLSWPPKEFCLPDNKEFVPHLGWNSPGHLAWLREWILRLQLPEWKHEFTTESWSEVCAIISDYVMQIPISPKSRPLFISRLDNLLERVRLKVAKSCQGGLDHWMDEDQGLGDAFNLVPWEEVVEVCIDHKLKEWQILEPPVCQGTVTEDGEVLVYFQSDSLRDFCPPEDWTKAVRQTHKEKQLEDRRLQPEASTPSSQQRLRQKLFHSVLESLDTPTPQLDISHTPTPDEILAHKVLQEIKDEKAESKRTMDQLQRWLDGEPLVNYSASLFLPSSILLTTSPVLRPTRETRSRGPTFTEAAVHDEPQEKDSWSKGFPVSMTQKLEELEQKILSSQKEEVACRLKLSGMLSIVDD